MDRTVIFLVGSKSRFYRAVSINIWDYLRQFENIWDMALVGQFVSLADATEALQLLDQVFVNLHRCYNIRTEELFDGDHISKDLWVCLVIFGVISNQQREWASHLKVNIQDWRYQCQEHVNRQVHSRRSCDARNTEEIASSRAYWSLTSQLSSWRKRLLGKEVWEPGREKHEKFNQIIYRHQKDHYSVVDQFLFPLNSLDNVVPDSLINHITWSQFVVFTVRRVHSSSCSQFGESSASICIDFHTEVTMWVVASHVAMEHSTPLYILEYIYSPGTLALWCGTHFFYVGVSVRGLLCGPIDIWNWTLLFQILCTLSDNLN